MKLFFMKEYAIIVAGGSGSRMKSDTPKQFLKLNDQPILYRTVCAFLHYSESIEIILVIPLADIQRWHKISTCYRLKTNIKIVNGGKSRYQSVKNGLQVIKDDNSLVAIHDGVRPLIKPKIIAKSFALAKIHGNAVASTHLKESIRMVAGLNNSTADRDKYRAIQTPQTFKTSIIKAAYDRHKYSKDFTDDASVVEKTGENIFLFEGSYENIKITTPDDMLFAEAVLKKE